MNASLAWPRQADVRKFYGEPGNPDCTAGMADLAYPMVIAWDAKQVIRRFRCHKLVEAPMERIFQKTLAHYGEAQIKKLGLNLFGGCYNLRQMRNGSAWSMHSWGIAVDLDPARNALNMKKPKAVFSGSAYDAFWNIVEGEGAISLGRARDFDWMHFQFARL